MRNAKPPTIVSFAASRSLRGQTKNIGRAKSTNSRMMLYAPTKIQPALLNPRFSGETAVLVMAMSPHITMNTVVIQAAWIWRLNVDNRRMSNDTASFEQHSAVTERMSLALIVYTVISGRQQDLSSYLRLTALSGPIISHSRWYICIPRPHCTARNIVPLSAVAINCHERQYGPDFVESGT